MSDKALIKACQKGEKQAFEDVIQMYYPYVWKFLIKTTADELLAQDLTQETFLKMIKSIETFNLGGKAAFGTWLITIAKNCYIDYLRKNKTYPVNLDDIQIDSQFDMEFMVTEKMRYEELTKAIEKLPPEQGIAIRMKYEQDLTLDEIAQQFNVPSKTVKSRIHDGTVKLCRMFANKERTE